MCNKSARHMQKETEKLKAARSNRRFRLSEITLEKGFKLVSSERATKEEQKTISTTTERHIKSR